MPGIGKLLPNQIIVKDDRSHLEWIWDVNPDEFVYLRDKGYFDESGNLILSMPFLASLKRFSPDRILESVSDYVTQLGIPTIKMDMVEPLAITLEDLFKSSNTQLEEYLIIFGGYRAYLDSELSKVLAKKTILEAGFDEGLNKMFYILSNRYREVGGKKPVKESLRGEAFMENPGLKKIRQDLIEVEALVIRLTGLRDSFKSYFDAVSRVTSLRISGKEYI